MAEFLQKEKEEPTATVRLTKSEVAKIRTCLFNSGNSRLYSFFDIIKDELDAM